VSAPVLAANVTISFSDLNLISRQDLEIYGYNDTISQWELLSIHNTSSPGLGFEDGNYNIIIRPSAVSRLTNPVTMMLDAFTFIETYWLQIGLAFVLIIAFIRKW
jgi:hypothetical protein